MEITRTVVASIAEKGRWNRAMGLKKSMIGQLLVAMMIPNTEESPSMSVVFFK